MDKAHKIITVFFVVAIIIIAVLFVAYVNVSNNRILKNETEYNPGNETIFFYGATCPHCKIVEDFMNQNNVTLKINIAMKESFENETNGKELISMGNYCKLPKESIGAVPLLYIDGKCYLGDVNDINYLKNKLGIT